jgi:2-hydroxychromene-2-carboxylate isomerase
MHQNGSAAQLDPAEFMYFTDSKQVNKEVSAPAIPQLSWGIVQSPLYCPKHAAFFGHLHQVVPAKVSAFSFHAALLVAFSRCTEL